MTDLDVLIRCHNSATHIVSAVRSVLGQTGIGFRVLLIDDASTDDTLDRVSSISDSRLTVIQRPSCVGEGASLNTLLDCSRSPYVVVMPEDGVLLPGGLARLVAALARIPEGGQACGGVFFVDGDQEVRRAQVADAARRHVERCTRSRGIRFLLAFGEAVGPVAYRRAALEAIGGFDTRLSEGARLDAAFRMSRAHDTEVLPELVCAIRRRRRRAPISVWRRLALYRRAAGRRDPWRAAVVGAWLARFDMFGRGRIRAAGGVARAARTYLLWNVAVPIWSRLYDYLVSHGSGWPIGVAGRGHTRRSPKRIAYFIWRYPVSSQTFVQRELAALEAGGVDLHVIAEGGDHDLPRVRRTEYLHPIRPRDLVRDTIAFALRRPFRLANLLAYVIFRTYRPPKSIAEDVRVFCRAVRLAAILRARRIDHLHSPWGDLSAFIAMVAARLAGIGFSVQFRAHDIHRRTAGFLVAEKIRNAAFVVTNSTFNAQHLGALADPGDRDKIHRVYNGLDLARLDSRPRGAAPLADARILSVARLIEPKGLVYLLAACRALRDSGYRFHCQIVGGAEVPLYVNDYIDIKSVYDKLDLGDCVEFLDAQPFSRVLQCYRQADMFVLPCVVGRDGSNDITPNALLEAMAMRLPVVSTPITAIPEIVEDGVSGILVRPNDSRALRDAMARLIDDPDLRQRLGENARARIEERFDIARNVRAYVALFGAA